MSDSGNDVVVEEIVEVVMVAADIEEAIALQTERLMYFEVKTDGFHLDLYILAVRY